MTAPDQAAAATPPTFPTSLGTSSADTITLLGRNLADDLIGQVSFGQLAYSLMTLREPTPGQLRLFEAVLVALADLGLPTELLRGVALLARCAGLLGQLAEELRTPIGEKVYMLVDRNAEYVSPSL